MRRTAVAVTAALALAASCSSDDASSSVAPTNPSTLSTTSSTTIPLVALSSCPVDDETFCEVAVEIAGALSAGDPAALVALSRADTIVCAEMAVEYFPQCSADDVLEGHGVSGPDLVVDVLDDSAYAAELDTLFTDVATPAIVGIGTCGPDVPGRRTYHVAWTATIAKAGAPPEPYLGSFELLFVDEWGIVLAYAGPVPAWEAANAGDTSNLFCEAARTDWPS